MRSAIIFGASGNIDSYLLKAMLKSSYYDEVKIVVRSPLDINHPKLTSLYGDDKSLEQLKNKLSADDLYIVISSSDRTVERYYPIQIARLCQQYGAQKVAIVSTIGADVGSWVAYTRRKGEIDCDIIDMQFQSTYIFRPAMIFGKRSYYRPFEKTMMALWRILDPIFKGKLEKYKGLEGVEIAHAMIRTMQDSKEQVLIAEYSEMEEASKQALI